MIETKLNLLGMTLNELNEEMLKIGEPKYRALQIFKWLHSKRIKDIDNMSDIPKSLKEKLKKKYIIDGLKIIKATKSKDNSTCKFLMSCKDNQIIESVLLSYKYGKSLCISSQVGCNMGCSFCASTIGGRTRNLSTAEMLSQIYEAESLIASRISHTVIMGIGEPMDNFDNFVKFVIILTEQNGYNMSRRNITVSTCGIVPKIYDLANSNLSITLAISLHSAFDDKRRKIMPIAMKYSISDLINACIYYFEKTGRRVTFEYSLIDKINDSKEDAIALSNLAKKVHAHVNLIPVNKIKENGYEPPSMKNICSFQNILKKNKVPSTIRRSIGDDIGASCGQLRKRYLDAIKGEYIK